MSDKKLDDQFNILFEEDEETAEIIDEPVKNNSSAETSDVFDDFEDEESEEIQADEASFDEIPEQNEEVEIVSEEDVAAPADTTGEDDDFEPEESFEEIVDEVPAEEQDLVDDTDFQAEMEDSFSVEELDAMDLDDSEEKTEEEYIPRRRRHAEERISEDELKREARNFWIFTAIIAFLVVLAVLFILWKREIIFVNETTQATVATKATEVAKSTESQTTTVAPTTTEEQTTTEETTTAETTVVETKPEEKVFENYENPFIVLDTDSLNIRQQPNATAPIIGSLKRYAGGEVIEDAGEWVHIKSGNVDGYVSKQFIKTGDDAKVVLPDHAFQAVKVKAETTLNVRATATADGAILGTVKRGQIIASEGLENGFYKITFKSANAEVGYVSADFCDFGYYLVEATAN